MCLSLVSSSVCFASLIRLDISQGFVEFIFQKYIQTLITIAYLSASSLEEFWWACTGRTVYHCRLKVAPLVSVQRKEWKLDCQSSPQ